MHLCVVPGNKFWKKVIFIKFFLYENTEQCGLFWASVVLAGFSIPPFGAGHSVGWSIWKGARAMHFWSLSNSKVYLGSQEVLGLLWGRELWGPPIPLLTDKCGYCLNKYHWINGSQCGGELFGSTHRECPLGWQHRQGFQQLWIGVGVKRET